MKTAELAGVSYRRLPGQGRAILGMVHLWLADDHLLQTTTGYVESYQRFFFEDIRALVITPSKRRLAWNLTLGGMLLIGGGVLLMAVSAGQAGCLVLAAVLMLPPAAALVYNNVRGPTARTYLVTGVETAVLLSFGRRRAAERALAELEPIIAAAQQRALRTAAAAPAPPPAPLSSPP